MSRNKPSPFETLILVVFLVAIIVPGIVVVAHDSLPRRLPGIERHQSGD